MIPSDARPLSGSFFAALARLATGPKPEQAGFFLAATKHSFGHKRECITLFPGDLTGGGYHMSNTDTGKGLGAGAAILHGLAKNWWLLLLRGIAAIVFGVLAFAWPGITIVSLVIVYGAYALVDGLFAIYAAIAGGNTAPRWWLAIVGVAGVLAGIISFVNPVLVGLWLLMLIAAWAIVSGIFEIIGAIRLRKEIDNEWWLILHGVISVLFGLLLFASPASGAVGLIWVIGAYAIVAGVILCALAFRLKKHA
jgi:uncharacterized membrane protein HdeD (DUF308 family)